MRKQSLAVLLLLTLISAPFGHSASAAQPPTANKGKDGLTEAEKYRRKLGRSQVGEKWEPIEDLLIEGEVGQAIDDDGRMRPALFGIVTNQGEHTFNRIDLAIFGLDKRGQAVFVAKHTPVDVRLDMTTPFGQPTYVNPGRDVNWPLGPGSQRYFQILFDHPPKSWVKEVDVNVSRFTLNK